MPVHKLDAAFCMIAECAPGKKKTDYYDTVTKGFCLEARAGGGKSFYLRYQDAHGRQKQHRIAGYGDATFDKIRREAQRLRSEVTLGGDPAGIKAEKKAVPTYGELADDHIAHSRTYMKSIRTLEGYMKRIKKRWGRVRLTDIRQQDVAAWLAELRKEGLAPATVEKTRVIMNRSFQLGAQWQVAGTDVNPVRGIPRPKFNNAREMFVDDQQAAELLAAASGSRNKQLRSIIALLLLTGMRVSELLSSRWIHVDLDRRTLFVPTSKNGRSRHVPLSQAAIVVVRELKQPNGAVFLFPNPKDPAKHLTTIKHGWQAVRDAVGLPTLRIHDLRHSFASAAVSAGVDLYHVGKIMGHQNVSSTARYSHVANSALMAAVEAGASKLNIGAAA